MDKRNELTQLAERSDAQQRKLIAPNDQLSRLGFLNEDREPLYQDFLRAWHERPMWRDLALKKLAQNFPRLRNLSRHLNGLNRYAGASWFLWQATFIRPKKHLQSGWKSLTSRRFDRPPDVLAQQACCLLPFSNVCSRRKLMIEDPLTNARYQSRTVGHCW